MQKSTALIPSNEDSAAQKQKSNYVDDSIITKPCKMKAVNEFDAENDNGDERPHYTISQIIKIARDSW